MSVKFFTKIFLFLIFKNIEKTASDIIRHITAYFFSTRLYA